MFGKFSHMALKIRNLFCVFGCGAINTAIADVAAASGLMIKLRPNLISECNKINFKNLIRFTPGGNSECEHLRVYKNTSYE